MEIVLIPEEIKREAKLSNSLVVVIDVLRASSTIVTALAEKAHSIVPVYLPEEAYMKRTSFGSSNVLLCGERAGKKLPDFDLGNSPLEYTRESVKNKTILLTTTNGVKTIELVKEADKVIIGSFLNINSIVQYCNSYSGSILLVCCGNKGEISLEDTVCAGMIAELCNRKKEIQLSHSDDYFIACEMYHRFKNDLLDMMKTSSWGKQLIKLGLINDLVYCSQPDIYRLIPVLHKDYITRMDEKLPINNKARE